MRKFLLAATAAIGAMALASEPAFAQREFRGGQEQRGDDGEGRGERGDGERRWRGGSEDSGETQRAEPRREAPRLEPPPQQDQSFRRPEPEPRDFSGDDRRGSGPRGDGARAGNPWRERQGQGPFSPPQGVRPMQVPDGDNELAGGPDERRGDGRRGGRDGQRDWGRNDRPGGEEWRERDGRGRPPGAGDGRPAPGDSPGQRDWGRNDGRGGSEEWRGRDRENGRDWGSDDRHRGREGWRDGARDRDWANNGRREHQRGRDWHREGRRDWADNEHWRRQWDHGRHDQRYRRHWHTHTDFAHPRYHDWRRVRHGYYFDHGYARILSRYYRRDYYWWSYDGWRRPHRDWRVGYVIPAWLWWEPLPWDLYYMLPPAPYGCRYIYADGDILLIAIASGIILDALLYDSGYY